MRESGRIAVVIPALDEADSIAGVLRRIPPWVDQVVVVDNGSTDATAEVARRCGSRVVREPRRGYGRACLAGIRAAAGVHVLVFLDADGSDHPEALAELVDPILRDEADLVLGSRTLGRLAPGAMTLPQRFGNVLAPWLIRLLWGQRFTDLGPFRAIGAGALQRLAMDAPTFAWTVQMQVRAARIGLRCREVPVEYSARLRGRSKISGTVRGVIGAGRSILGCIAAEAIDSFRRGVAPGDGNCPSFPRNPRASAFDEAAAGRRADSKLGPFWTSCE